MWTTDRSACVCLVMSVNITCVLSVCLAILFAHDHMNNPPTTKSVSVLKNMSCLSKFQQCALAATGVLA